MISKFKHRERGHEAQRSASEDAASERGFNKDFSDDRGFRIKQMRAIRGPVLCVRGVQLRLTKHSQVASASWKGAKDGYVSHLCNCNTKP